MNSPIFAGDMMAVRTFWTALRTASHTHGARRPDTAAPAPREVWGAYLATMAGAALALLSLLWLGLAAFDHFDLLPPPQLSNNLCMDQKLAYFRAHPVEEPTILATCWGCLAIIQRSGCTTRTVKLDDLTLHP